MENRDRNGGRAVAQSPAYVEDSGLAISAGDFGESSFSGECEEAVSLREPPKRIEKNPDPRSANEDAQIILSNCPERPER